MIITRATEYSIRATLCLAKRHELPVVSKQEICEAEGITPAFLTKILQPLIRNGLVRSKRGVSGGFALARDPRHITLLDVMRAVEEPLALNICLLEGHGCNRQRGCPVHDLWGEAKKRIEEVLSSRSLAELAAVPDQQPEP